MFAPAAVASPKSAPSPPPGPATPSVRAHAVRRAAAAGDVRRPNSAVIPVIMPESVRALERLGAHARLSGPYQARTRARSGRRRHDLQAALGRFSDHGSSWSWSRAGRLGRRRWLGPTRRPGGGDLLLVLGDAKYWLRCFCGVGGRVGSLGVGVACAAVAQGELGWSPGAVPALSAGWVPAGRSASRAAPPSRCSGAARPSLPDLARGGRAAAPPVRHASPSCWRRWRLLGGATARQVDAGGGSLPPGLRRGPGRRAGQPARQAPAAPDRVDLVLLAALPVLTAGGAGVEALVGEGSAATARATRAVPRPGRPGAGRCRCRAAGARPGQRAPGRWAAPWVVDATCNAGWSRRRRRHPDPRLTCPWCGLDQVEQVGTDPIRR